MSTYRARKSLELNHDASTAAKGLEKAKARCTVSGFGASDRFFPAKVDLKTPVASAKTAHKFEIRLIVQGRNARASGCCIFVRIEFDCGQGQRCGPFDCCRAVEPTYHDYRQWINATSW